jgi:hypothetical protein
MSLMLVAKTILPFIAECMIIYQSVTIKYLRRRYNALKVSEHLCFRKEFQSFIRIDSTINFDYFKAAPYDSSN